MNKFYLNILLFLFIVVPLRGQQESSFNHYMFNSQLFNPAFVGLEENLTISSLNNIQWVGFDGNPSTNSLLFDASLDNNLGVGAEVISDRIGPLNSNYLAIDLSYHLPLNNKLQKYDVETMSIEELHTARIAFEPRWNRSNVIRTFVACCVSFLLIVLALRQ